MIAELLLGVMIAVQAAPMPAEPAEQEPWLDYMGTYEITAYNVYEGGGENYGTASGMEPVAWYTCATSSDIPFGTVLYIEDYGEFIVADRGGPTIESGERIDVFVGTDDCEAIGLQTKDVYIVRY